MMEDVRVLVLEGVGINCEQETAHAFRLAGADVNQVHIYDLLDRRSEKLEDYQILAIPGGFSYGDEIAAGKILGDELKGKIGDELHEFFSNGKLGVGICNGAQALVKMGFVPEADENYSAQAATITMNDSGKFVDRWVDMIFDYQSPCVFTRDIESLRLPIRHGEGSYVFGADIYEQVRKNHQIVATYNDMDVGPYAHFDPKPVNDTAAICNKKGTILAIMPHPEGYMFAGQNAQWWRKEKEILRRKGEPINAKAPGPGLKVFINGVNYAKEHLV